MRRRTMVLMAFGASLALLAGCAPTPSPPDALTPNPPAAGLRVMTYNVLGAQGDDRVYSEQAGWAARIDQLRPDVVVLQEAQSDDVNALVARLATRYALASYVQWDCDLKPDREGVAILVRSSLGVLGSGGTHVGETCTEPSIKRVLVWADLDLATGPLRIYGTHLTASGGAGAGSRDAQIRAIRRTIAADDPTGARRWIFAGDVNATPSSSSYALIVGEAGAADGAGRFVDAVAEVRPEAASTTTCPTIGADDAAGQAALLANPELVRRCGYSAGWAKDDNWLACELLSFCTSWERRRDTSVRERIDDVFVAAGGPVSALGTFVPNRADADWASPGAEWFRLSDHLPTVVDVEVAATT